ncbi:hypothetical protein [Streptomyces mirabilis]|uniref:hypothetical protein n=1 Tax=Streptomyces mirabilis TaxID=68239 RepID=UPI003415D99F
MEGGGVDGTDDGTAGATGVPPTRAVLERLMERMRQETGHVLGAFSDQYSSPFSLLGDLLIAVPGVIGVFWAAPLGTRELETGAHRLG